MMRQPPAKCVAVMAEPMLVPAMLTVLVLKYVVYVYVTIACVCVCMRACMCVYEVYGNVHIVQEKI